MILAQKLFTARLFLRKVDVMKKKLAIVSSYGELCGNATYSEALRIGFSKYFDVKVFALPVRLLNETNNSSKKMAQKIMDDFSAELKEFDYVNIQFERGLYGLTNSDVYNNFVKLASACPKTMVTVHRYDLPMSFLNRGCLKNFLSLQLKAGLQSFISTFKNNYAAKVYKEILAFCEKKKIGVMVHTSRERFLISMKFEKLNIFDCPISFLNKELLLKYKSEANRELFLKENGFDEKDVVIGIFGFVSEYKGHHVAIKALKYLPENYKLAIFGGQHPGSIKQGMVVDPYINSLLTLINQEELEKRVQFCGALDDDGFINALLCSDFNLLPYFETGQSGSGVASLSLETGGKLIMSQNLAFIELSKYAKNAFKMFSIGNYIELADCILNFKKPLTQGLEAYFEKYNLDEMVKVYMRYFESGSR